MSDPVWLNPRDIVAIHAEILAATGGTPGILSQDAIDSTLHKPQHRYYYGQPNLYELAATYGYGFVKNHCFVDGNKRVALIATYTFLGINGIELNATEVDAASYFEALAASQESQDVDIKKLSIWLKDNSHPNLP